MVSVPARHELYVALVVGFVVLVFGFLIGAFVLLATFAGRDYPRISRDDMLTGPGSVPVLPLLTLSVGICFLAVYAGARVYRKARLTRYHAYLREGGEVPLTWPQALGAAVFLGFIAGIFLVSGVENANIRFDTSAPTTIAWRFSSRSG